MCISNAQRRTMCPSVKAIWSQHVLVIAVAVALTVGVQRVGALPSQPAALQKFLQRITTKSELWGGQHQEVPEVSQTNAALDEISAYRRKAVRDEAKRWPNAIVPYLIAPSIDRVSSTARSVIKEAINRWEKETCVRFVPANRLKDKDLVVIQQGSWCSSYVGRIGGRQAVSLALRCLTVGTVMHELGHAIGWKHEHSRPDRDKFIEIVSEKTNKLMDSNYAKYDYNHVNTFDVPYDYGSIMHYPGNPNTIRAIDPTMQRAMGQRLRLSFFDVKLANLMYKCAERKRCNLRSTKCTGEGYVGPTCKCVCPDGSTRCAVNNTSKKPAVRFFVRKLKVKRH